MIQGMIFDLDGTLLDSMFLWSTAGGTYLQRNVSCRIDSMRLHQVSVCAGLRELHLALARLWKRKRSPVGFPKGNGTPCPAGILEVRFPKLAEAFKAV